MEHEVPHPNFMEDVALATDDTSDEDVMMTIQGPACFRGMEEDLFPVAMSMSTRRNYRRTTIVLCTLTREHQAYLTYAQSRYR
jgi:DNA helicase-2/ATP-dependent DNA helicase PcrA